MCSNVCRFREQGRARAEQCYRAREATRASPRFCRRGDRVVAPQVLGDAAAGLELRRRRLQVQRQHRVQRTHPRGDARGVTKCFFILKLRT